MVAKEEFPGDGWELSYLETEETAGRSALPRASQVTQLVNAGPRRRRKESRDSNDRQGSDSEAEEERSDGEDEDKEDNLDAASEQGLLHDSDRDDPHDTPGTKHIVSDDTEDSPYAEVRAAVHNYDEDMPCNTIRAWTIGLCLVVAGSAMNTLFSLRQPSISIDAFVAQVIAWPLGHAWARFMPDLKPLRVFGISASLNPGPFNVKEHAIIVVMASVSFGVAYATDVILVQMVFYKQDFGFIFQFLLTLTTQSLGYGIAGLLRRFLVYPASMIWPANLAVVALLNAFHDRQDRDPSVFGGRMPRYYWFGLVAVGCMIYSFIPGFLARFLSVFAFITWLAPRNPIVNQIFGGFTGLSLLPISFDWAQIAGYIGSPLIYPWSSISNIIGGVIIFNILGACVLHYSNVWYGSFLPIGSAETYDNTGSHYNITRVLNANLTFNEAAYQGYSPLFISAQFAMSYGLSFAAISSLVVYIILYHGKEIWQQYRDTASVKPDIHMKLMRKYLEAPDWWYYSLFGIILSLALLTVLAFPTNLTWWALFLAIFISFGFSLPIGIVQAVTNQQLGLNVLTEFVYGYIQPGKPVALMLFKTFGYITMYRALDFVADLKFGHYMKIPPRVMFTSQVVATTVACFVQIVALRLSLSSIEGVCTRDQPESFTCPNGRVFFSASVIWGLIGPSRMFSPGQIYTGLLAFFGIGAAASAVIWAAVRRWPTSWARHVITPLVFGGSGKMPPATPLNYLTWATVGWVFQFYIRKHYFGWWRRLNFLTSAGLDLGLGLATLIIFFAFTLHRISPPAWWGNEIVRSTMDYQIAAIQNHVPEGGHFGPAVW